MNRSSYQTPTNRSMIALPIRRVLWTDFRRRQRMIVRRVHLETARFTTVDSRYWSRGSRMEHLVKQIGVVFIEVLPVLVVRHLLFPCRPHWRGKQAYPTNTLLRSFFCLTGCPKVGKLIVSRYQPSRQTGFGCSMKASLPTERGFRAFIPTTAQRVADQSTIFNILFACFAFALFAPSGRRFFIGCEVLEGKGRSCDHVAQSVQKQIGTLAAIESKLHFLQVGR